MDIALVHTPLVHPTGGERQILMLAYYLKKFGHNVTIFTNFARRDVCFPELFSKLEDVIEVVNFPVRIPFYHYNMYFGIARIAKSIASHNYDIINPHNFPTEWIGYFINKYNKGKRPPVVWMCNEPPFWFFIPQMRKGLNRVYWPLFEIFDRKVVQKHVDKIVVLSNFIGKITRNIYDKQYYIVRSGFDVKTFSGINGLKFREKYGLQDNFIILQVGSIVPYKNPNISVLALASLKRWLGDIKDIKLIFIGQPNRNSQYYRYLVTLIRKLNLQNNVLFLGSVQDDILKQAYVAADVFVFPSFQSWSLVTIEAMAAKTPVIVSDKCGVSEIISHGKNGFIARYSNYIEIAKYLKLLYENPDIKVKIGQHAYEYIKNTISWENYAKNMESIFKMVLQYNKN
ncbi:glycosyltransferase family 4 protein [Thermococcus sp.]